MMDSRNLIDILINGTESARIMDDIIYADIEDLKSTAKSDTRLKRFDLWSNGRWIYLQAINVSPESRGQGVGKEWIKKVQDVAKKLNQPIILSPEAERGHKGDLHRFYRDLGFKPNSGRKARSDLGGAFGGEWIWFP